MLGELVRESVRGMESRALTRRACHQTILPFTRYLAGPADYTTMIFSERRHDSSIPHQIATMAVFSSPLLTIAAHPSSILANPAVEIIKSIPSVWDETIVLPPSEISELAVFARRSGTTWFLAVMNGSKARVLRVPLSFLDTGSYRGLLASDDENKEDGIVVRETGAGKGDVLTISLRDGGGFIGRFSKE